MEQDYLIDPVDTQVAEVYTLFNNGIEARWEYVGLADIGDK